MVVGDFNLYHRAWFGKRVPFQESQPHHAQSVVTTMGEHEMTLLTRKGAITRPKAARNAGEEGKVIDLTWATADMADRLERCKVAKDMKVGSDHWPVEAIFQVQTEAPPEEVRPNYKEMDVQKFRDVLRRELEDCKITDWPADLKDGEVVENEDIDAGVEELVKALQVAAGQAVPKARLSYRSKAEIDGEVKEIIEALKKASRKWRRTGEEDDHVEVMVLKRRRKTAIQRVGREKHRTRIETCENEKQLYALSRWSKSHGRAANSMFTPSIKQGDGQFAEDPAAKAEAFKHVFFPPPPEADLSDMEGFEYGPAKGRDRDITVDEVEQALRDCPPTKRLVRTAFPTGH